MMPNRPVNWLNDEGEHNRPGGAGNLAVEVLSVTGLDHIGFRVLAHFTQFIIQWGLQSQADIL